MMKYYEWLFTLKVTLNIIRQTWRKKNFSFFLTSAVVCFMFFCLRLFFITVIGSIWTTVKVFIRGRLLAVRSNTLFFNSYFSAIDIQMFKTDSKVKSIITGHAPLFPLVIFFDKMLSCSYTCLHVTTSLFRSRTGILPSCLLELYYSLM